MKKELRQRHYVCEKYKGHCAYCGKHIEYQDMQVDHLWPKKYGLKGKTVNDIENLMPSCRRCNHYKRSNRLEEYRRMIQTLNDRIFKTYIGKVAIDYGTVRSQKWNGLFYFERN